MESSGIGNRPQPDLVCSQTFKNREKKSSISKVEDGWQTRLGGVPTCCARGVLGRGGETGEAGWEQGKPEMG